VARSPRLSHFRVHDGSEMTISARESQAKLGDVPWGDHGLREKACILGIQGSRKCIHMEDQAKFSARRYTSNRYERNHSETWNVVVQRGTNDRAETKRGHLEEQR